MFEKNKEHRKTAYKYGHVMNVLHVYSIQCYWYTIHSQQNIEEYKDKRNRDGKREEGREFESVLN